MKPKNTNHGLQFVSLALVLCFALSVMLSGCSNGPGKPSGTATNSDTKQRITLGAMEDVKTGTANNGTTLVFDMLTALTPHNIPVPNLVASWELKNDNKTYVLHLQPDVVFSNGDKLTAEVAKFSMEYWAPYKEKGYLYVLESFNVIDETTLEVNFYTPYPALPNDLAGIPAMLPNNVDDKGNITDWTGTGPFIISEYRTNQSATLIRNENYWNAEKKPGIATVVWQVIPDENARVLALQGGQIDAIGVTEHHLSMSYNIVPQLESDENLTVLKQESGGLNTTYVYNYLNGAMADINLRKAVTFSIDRETLAAQVLRGIPQASGHFIPLENRFSPQNETEYTYDFEAAKQALQSAGYADSNGDGIVEKNGAELKLTLLTQTGDNYKTDAVFVQDALRQIGIETAIVALEANSFYERASAGEFDISFTHPWTTYPYSYLN
jgi:peptide/nickel transport system substrate-binding protein/nickel transport system substrate-binding protein